MARTKVTLNHGAIKALLESGEIAALTTEATEAVADYVRGLGIRVDGVPGVYELPVEVQMVTTDRAHGIVTLAHPAGEAVQAKHGALTKGAAAAGLEVNGA